MEYKLLNIDGIVVSMSSFASGDTGDFFFAAYGDPEASSFGVQAGKLKAAIDRAAAETCPGAACVFKRYFLSDAANYDSELKACDDLTACACSVIEQPPLTGSKIAVLARYQTGVKYEAVGEGIYEATAGAFAHIWTASEVSAEEGEYRQAYDLLDSYAERLKKRGCNLELNCIRTWFFIHNIDEYYAGMVRGRNDLFDRHKLIRGNHFIASTGICGRTRDASKHVMMDAYAVRGLKREQIRFLQAPTHLNNTQDYGVRFERGTAVDYGDRREVFISGTASIDNKGEVLHLGDVRKQALRAMENIDALLREAACTSRDVAQLIVYLRDFADRRAVEDLLEAKYGACPRIVVLAPVCRPTWLIEIECIAIKAQSDSRFENY